MGKPRLLLIGDGGCASGFERGTRYYAAGLEQQFEVHVLALNYWGDPQFINGEAQPWPYRLWSAPCRGDWSGINRLPEMINRLDPVVIVVQSDPWHFEAYISAIRKLRAEMPIIGVIAVDGKNCRGSELNGLNLAVFWTTFGEEQARLGGYTGESCVIPLGVDLDIYTPQGRMHTREHMNGLREALAEKGLGLDAFIVGVVGRNQARKRLDLAIEYFAEWTHGGTPVEQRSAKTIVRRDAALWLHVAPTGEQAYDLDQMAAYYGVTDHVIIPDIPVDGRGLSEELLASIYTIFDIGFSTTQGEGFGLPVFEMMACGVPSVVPEWSAFGELVQDGVTGMTIPCSTTIATDRGINVIGGIADKRSTVLALDYMYTDRRHRDELGQRATAFIGQHCFRWQNIGNAILGVTLSVLQAVARDREAVA